MEDAFSILTPLLAVAVVIAGAYWTTKWMAGRHGAYSSGRHIQVLERVMVAKDTYLALIRVGSQTHLASVSPGRVEWIREMDTAELAGIEAKRAGNDFLGMLVKAAGKGKTHPAQKEDGGERGGDDQ